MCYTKCNGGWARACSIVFEKVEKHNIYFQIAKYSGFYARYFILKSILN